MLLYVSVKGCVTLQLTEHSTLELCSALLWTTAGCVCYAQLFNAAVHIFAVSVAVSALLPCYLQLLTAY
jgi:hypothetical protein